MSTNFFIGLEQYLQGHMAIHRDVLTMRKQGVFLPFDELAILIGKSCIFS